MSDSLRPHGLYSSWNSPDQNTGVGSLSLLQGIFPTIEPRSPALQVDSLPAEPQGKSKNTGMGSLSLFQGIFLTQGSNWGLLRCRQILYQLSYEGSHGSIRGQVQCSCCSGANLCSTVYNPMDYSRPGFPVFHNLPEFAQVHVHWVGDAI